MNKPKSDLIKEVEEYQKKVSEYEAELKEKQVEHDAESAKNPKFRKRKLSDINSEIQELRNAIWRLRPKKKCSNCNRELDYDDLICWHCGEVFFDVCPRCKSLSVEKNDWGLLKCSKCGLEYRDLDLLEDLLRLGADPSSRFHNVLDPKQHYSVSCYNIGVKKNTIWQLCKEYACPFEEKCEYYCPAFLAVLALVYRGKVSTGLPWGYDQGGDLNGYKIRWKRSKWYTE
jgi:predicted RNA-binding Zn-ribbon protein involved in translation (DUF1610 family)